MLINDSRPLVHNLEIQPSQFVHVTWFQCIGIDVVHVVLVEEAGLAAIEEGLHAWRICDAEYAPRRVFARRTDDRDALRHHDLISTVRMAVSTTHEARLARMGMNPSKHHQVFCITIVK